MISVCVFGGARSGHDHAFRAAAEALGQAIAERNATLVFGGGRIGMMGHLADAAIAHGAEVIGVIPAFLDHADIVHGRLSEKIVVGDLFARKERMMALGNLFIAMPGGLGTLDELLEVITWRQLRQLHGPVGVLDTSDFFAPWFGMLDRFAEAGFINAVDVNQIVRHSDPALLLESLLSEIET